MAKLADSIVVSIGGKAIELCPSLRFAIRLERRPGSFAGLLREIMDGSLTATAAVIRDHYDHPMLEQRILDTGIETFRDPILSYVAACAGIDPDAPANDNGTPEKGKSQSIGEYLTELFKFGAGWQGWTPEETLNATPYEIALAREGKVEMLRAIFGGTDDKRKKRIPATDENLKMAFADLGAKLDNRSKEA